MRVIGSRFSTSDLLTGRTISGLKQCPRGSYVAEHAEQIQAYKNEGLTENPAGSGCYSKSIEKPITKESSVCAANSVRVLMPELVVLYKELGFIETPAGSGCFIKGKVSKDSELPQGTSPAASGECQSGSVKAGNDIIAETLRQLGYVENASNCFSEPTEDDDSGCPTYVQDFPTGEKICIPKNLEKCGNAGGTISAQINSETGKIKRDTLTCTEKGRAIPAQAQSSELALAKQSSQKSEFQPSHIPNIPIFTPEGTQNVNGRLSGYMQLKKRMTKFYTI